MRSVRCEVWQPPSGTSPPVTAPAHGHKMTRCTVGEGLVLGVFNMSMFTYVFGNLVTILAATTRLSTHQIYISCEILPHFFV